MKLFDKIEPIYFIEYEFNTNKDIEGIAMITKGRINEIDEVKKEFNLTDEEGLLLKLIYAREKLHGFVSFLGDRLLKEVEKTKGKSERVKAILDKVRKNRVIYKNSIENRKYLHCKMIKVGVK